MYDVLIIDDSLLVLAMARDFLQTDYNVITYSSSKEALTDLKNGTILPSLILLDIEMPIRDGFAVIVDLKLNDKLKDIPVIFLSGLSNEKIELRGLSLGAVDYITKPFSPPLVKKRIQLHLQLMEQQKELRKYNDELEHMVEEKTRNIIQLQYAVIYTIADLIEKKDGYTGGHAERVRYYFEVLLRQMVADGAYEGEISLKDVPSLALSSRLHDVGKIAIPDVILLKNGKLEDTEFEQMKGHSFLGSEAIMKSLVSHEESEHLSSHTLQGADSLAKSISFFHENVFLHYALDMARHHHEKWNGKGYPDGLQGQEIPLVARAISIADVYDALRSARPYKAPFLHEVAVDIIIGESGKSFDPILIEVFKKCACEFETLASEFASKTLDSF